MLKVVVHFLSKMVVIQIILSIQYRVSGMNQYMLMSENKSAQKLGYMILDQKRIEDQLKV